MFLVIIPVLVPYFLSFDLTMEQVFQLQAIFGFTVAVLEVPSGYFCDLFGRKLALIIGSAFTVIGHTGLYFIDSYSEFVAYEITLGIALSLISGADLSILFDSLNEINNDRDERTKAVANIQLSTTGSEAIASILSGFLVMISFKAVVIAQAIAGWFTFFIAFTLKEPNFQKMSKSNHLENIKKIYRHLFTTDKLLRLSFINLIVWGLSTFFAVWIFQKYWMENQIPLTYFGFIWAGYNFSVGLIGKQVHRLEKKYGPILILVFIGILPIVGYFGMAFFSGWVGVVFGLAFQACRGLNSVILKDALNWRTPSEFRATVNSLHSLGFRLGFCIFGPGVGYLIDKEGISFTLSILGIVFMILYIVFLIPLIKTISDIDKDIIPKSS